MASTTPLSSSTATMQADVKISNDLAVLKEKMDLLEEMLNPPDVSAPRLSVKTDEAVRSVIGFLDACGPRMIELVTACTSSPTGIGVLSEEVFGDVLGCNDRLQKLLSDVDTLRMTETPASTTVAAASSPDALLTDQFGDLLLGSDDDDNNNLFAEAPPAGAKTTGEDEPDGDDDEIHDDAAFQKDIDDFFQEAKEAPAPAPAGAPPVPPTTPDASGGDPFDDFFAERTESSNFP